MKINKYLPIAICATALIPIAGLLFSLLSICKNGKNRISFLLISFFYFFFLIRLPPYGDSYRRYGDFLSYAPHSEVTSFLSGHPDIFYYLGIVVFRNLDIAYYIMPATYGALMIYLLLASLRNMLFIFDCELSGFKKISAYVLLLSAFDIVGYSLGLRFGLSITLAVYAISTYSRGDKLKAILAMIITLLVHFSMALIVIGFIASRFVNLNKKKLVLFSIISYVLSSTILPFILTKISLGGIGAYAISGYVDGVWANASDNLNTKGVFFIRNMLQLSLLVLFLRDKNSVDIIDRAICLIIPLSFLTAVSFTAFQRYLVVCSLLLMVRIIPPYIGLLFRKIYLMIGFCFYVFVSAIVLNIYVQRMPFIWGDLWRGYYQSPLTLINYDDKKFTKYLNEVTLDGDWVKNRQGEKG